MSEIQANNDKKRYWWIKLSKDFFDKHYIKVINKMPNGEKYILIYLRLMCESVSHNGMLRFSDTIPYNEDMLSAILDCDIDTLRSAMKIFRGLKLIELMDDGTYYMAEVNKILGSETGQTIRKNLYKTNQKLIEGKKEVNFTKDIDIDKELDIDINTNNMYCLLPLVNGDSAIITTDDISLWKESYPAVSIETEIKKILSWLDANPKNRKTQSGWKRFVVNWLSKAQNEAKPGKKKPEQDVPEWLEEYKKHFEEGVEDL